MQIPISVELLQSLEKYLQRKPYFEVNPLLTKLGEEIKTYSVSLNKGPDPVEQDKNQEELPLDVTN
jgi:hypothetical protein|tara:strand:- start:245 stop:442 length:198 start_codon:yes stop_codon:yes gene_type:complete